MGELYQTKNPYGTTGEEFPSASGSHGAGVAAEAEHQAFGP